MREQNTHTYPRDDTWIGTVVGAGLVLAHIVTRTDDLLLILAYVLLAAATVLSGWSKAFFWSMTIGLALAFGLWQLYLHL